MSLPFKVLGAPGSPYSRKLRSVLRYRRIPFTWANRNSKEDVNTPTIPVNLLPVMILPGENGDYSKAKIDSTPIIRYLEEQYSERSVIPSDPVSPVPVLSGISIYMYMSRQCSLLYCEVLYTKNTL